MKLSVVDYLKKHIEGTLAPDDTTAMTYPPPIALTLGFNLVAIGKGEATIEMTTDPAKHANPMGTIHGGVLCDIADAAIGTAHVTTLEDGETFTSIDLKINFFRPVWDAKIKAEAKAVHLGKTTSYYECEVRREDDNKLIAKATSTVMTLRGGAAKGR